MRDCQQHCIKFLRLRRVCSKKRNSQNFLKIMEEYRAFLGKTTVTVPFVSPKFRLHPHQEPSDSSVQEYGGDAKLPLLQPPVLEPNTQPLVETNLEIELVRAVLKSEEEVLEADPISGATSRKDIDGFCGGQLGRFVTRWRQLGAPLTIQKTITGYTIPFIKKPPSVPLKDPVIKAFATKSSTLMDKEIKEMLRTGVIEECHERTGFLSRMFLIPKQNGKLRQIFDLRRLNLYLNPRKFRLINQSNVPKFLQKGDWMGKLDISQAYFHVPIKPSHRRYLAFHYKKLYQMTCLPFGLSSAPLAFSRVTNWVANLLRKRGLRVLVYLDDFLVVHQNPSILEQQMCLAVNLLQSLGWSVNVQKSILVPTRQIEFLGIIWDTEVNQTRLPPGKVKHLSKEIQVVLEKGKWSWKSAMSLVGRLGFASLVVPLGRLHTRNLQRASRNLSEEVCHKVFDVPSSALADCLWWTHNISTPGRIFENDPTIFISTDASDQGWGIQLGNSNISGTWSAVQSQWHINRKELFTVLIALVKFHNILQNKAVMIQSDNKSVVAYLRNQGGTKSMVLLELTRKIYHLSAQMKAQLNVFYIPGRYNTMADRLSRGTALPDWHLSEAVTRQIFQRWGIPQIDLFASHQSKVVPLYVSIDALDHQAAFINAFSQNWEFQLAWVFPPPPLIPKVLQHLNKASGWYLVVVPRWEHVFWRNDLKRRAVDSPFLVKALHQQLMDLSTGLPPPNVKDLSLEVWKVRGGPSLPRIYRKRMLASSNQLGESRHGELTSQLGTTGSPGVDNMG